MLIVEQPASPMRLRKHDSRCTTHLNQIATEIYLVLGPYQLLPLDGFALTVDGLVSTRSAVM